MSPLFFIGIVKQARLNHLLTTTNHNEPADQQVTAARALIREGDFQGAYRLLSSAKDAPSSKLSPTPDTLYLLAVCLRKLKRHSEALDQLDVLLELEPDNGHAHQEQAYNWLESQQTSKAVRAFEKAVALNPALHGAWRALSQIPSYSNKEEAIRQLVWFESLPPELVSVTSFIHQKKLLKAEALCRQFVQRQPKHPEAMRLLAEIGRRFYVLDDAEVLLQKCLEIAPQHHQARLDYIDVLQRRQKFSQALKQAQKLVQSDSKNPGFRISLGNAQQANGLFDEAIQSYRQVLEHAPQHASLSVALGNALKTIGDTPNAINAYQNAFQAKQGFGEAYWSLANLKTYRFSDAELDQMHNHLDGSEVDQQDQTHLCFALGKAYEDDQAFDKSFEFYRQGNAHKESETAFDFGRLRDEIDHQKARYDAAFFEQRVGFGCAAPDPIFILGLPRAGSTLLEQILASHSQVDGTMELANIIAYAHRLSGRTAADEKPKYPAILEKMTQEQSQRLGELYLKETAMHRQDAPFFIDKMPNNFRHIALIALILPNAKIIDARREPMACCFSGYKQLFAEGQEFSYTLDGIGHYYRDYVEIMEHWQSALPNRILRVQHEDVLDDLETQVARILDFCGLEFEQACVDFHQTKRAVKTPSSEQVRQPIFKTSMQQWRNYESHLGPLKQALGFAI